MADTWPGFADLAHQTIWIRSPPFRLTGNGDLGFWIFGGGTNALATPPANEAAVPTNSVDTANGGWHGVALRNVANGDFVVTGQRTNSATDWQYVRFTAAQLAALDTNAVYTLDVVDARNNTWGWFNFDSARIPGVLVPQKVQRLHSPAAAGRFAASFLAALRRGLPPRSGTGFLG